MSSEVEELRAKVDGLQRLVEAMMEYMLVETARHRPEPTERIPTPAPGPSSIEYINFHPEEPDGAGNTYRWSGPSPVATLRMQLDRESDHTLGFYLVSRAISEERQPIRCYVDGRPVEPRIEGAHWSVPISANPTLSRLPTVVAIDVRETFCPHEAGHSEDRRHLGIAIQGVEIL